jgi:hypothetical protein
MFSPHFARGAKRCPISASSPVAVDSGNSCPSLTYWECERAISKRQFLCYSFRHLGTQHARSSIATHELRILTCWFFKLISSTRAAFIPFLDVLSRSVRSSCMSVWPFPNRLHHFLTCAPALRHYFACTPLPVCPDFRGACFIRMKRCTSRTSSRDRCPCHCTSTYPMHGIWLTLAPSVACYSYYKCYLQPQNKTHYWHKSCATRKLIDTKVVQQGNLPMNVPRTL